MSRLNITHLKKNITGKLKIIQPGANDFEFGHLEEINYKSQFKDEDFDFIDKGKDDNGNDKEIIEGKYLIFKYDFQKNKLVLMMKLIIYQHNTFIFLMILIKK